MFGDDGGFEIKKCVINSNIFSICSPKLSEEQICTEDDFVNSNHNFQKRCAALDINKKVIEYIKVSDADFLVLDMTNLISKKILKVRKKGVTDEYDFTYITLTTALEENIDLLDNMVKSYKPSVSATGAAVVAGISGACLSEHDFTFYSDLDSTAEEVEFVNKNPVDAILGEDGLIAKYGGELARDWFDVFLVKRVGTDSQVQIRQGKNLLGITYDVDITDVVTRIMPTGEDKDGNVLYLPEGYVDSPHIGDYTQPKWIHLAVSGAREVTKGKSQDKKSKAQCYTEMRQAAQAEFDKGCDLPTITLKVDFINCAETEEYRQYNFLQNIFLGDSVRVIAGRIGVAVSMRMTQ